MAARHLTDGARGEELAGAHLASKGYTVLARNWRPTATQNRGGRTVRLELDIVARQGKTLVFIEVKTRAGAERGRPEGAVSPAKQQKLAEAAARYLTETDGWEQPCRFDIVAVLLYPGAEPEITHTENAFGLADAFPGGHAAWQPF